VSCSTINIDIRKILKLYACVI